MKQSITLGVTLACAQAIQLSSKAEVIPGIPSFDFPDIPIISDIPDVLNEGIDFIDTGLTDFGDIVIDGIDVTIGSLEPTVTLINEEFTDLGEIVFEDGLEPIGEMGEIIFEVHIEPGFDKFADFVVDDVGDFVIDDVGGFVVDDIGGVVTDTYDWASSDGNWEAFGKTVLGGYKLYFKGDFDGAAHMWLNEEHYTEEYWDQLDKDRRDNEEAARIAEENKRKK